MQELPPPNDLTMSVASGLFLDYCILEGMLAVVKDYTEKNTFEDSLDTQRQLIADTPQQSCGVSDPKRLKNTYGNTRKA